MIYVHVNMWSIDFVHLYIQMNLKRRVHFVNFLFYNFFFVAIKLLIYTWRFNLILIKLKRI